MVMHFTQCCCGCSVKTGSIIIGVVGATQGLLSLVLIIIDAINPTTKQNSILGDKNDKEALKTVVIYRTVSAIASAINLILNIMLVVGASTRKPKLIKPWIVGAVIGTVLAGIYILFQAIMLLVAGEILAVFLGLVICALIMCVWVYDILVVNSLHTELISQLSSNEI